MNSRKWTPLHRASYKGDFHDSQTSDESINTIYKNCFFSKIDDCFTLGHNGVVEVLLRNGANISATNRYKGQPIHKAADQGAYFVAYISIYTGIEIYIRIRIPIRIRIRIRIRV